MDLQYKEITKDENLKKIIKETVTEMAEAVVSTMGPYGKTVILTNKFEGPYLTKDGVSVIKAISFNDPVKNEIAKIVKEVAEKTLKVAGDGTTTSVCFLSGLVSVGLDELSKPEVDYMKVLKDLNQLEEIVVEEINKMSIELKKENIKDVAIISANGDKAMGEIIEEAFYHSSNVKVELGIDFFDKVEKVNGMVLETGYIDPALVNVPEKDSIVYDNPKIIIIDGKLNDLRTIGSVLENKEGPFIIIADDISANVQSIIRDNYNRGALSIGFMKTPGFGGHRKNLVKDLEYFTESKKVELNSKHVEYGNVDSIQISRDKTIITKKKMSDECKKHLNNLKELNSNTGDGQIKDLLQKRIDNLIGTLSIIKVGGISSVEVNEKYDRYDDAVKAVTCALEEGIIPGGGMSLVNIHHDRRQDLKNNMFLHVLLDPLNQIEKNSEYKIDIVSMDVIKEKIFDPAKVTKTAFVNAVSISKSLLNANNLILDRMLWQ